MQGAAPDASRIAHMNDSTLSQIVRLSIGGDRWRLQLSNAESAAVLNIGTVHVALLNGDGTTVPGTDREVRFRGSAAVSIPMHGVGVSDAIPLPVRARTSVAVSMFFPEGAEAATFRCVADATGQLAPGNQTMAVTLQAAEPVDARAVLEAIDVDGARRSVVVAIGDSITDGVHSTVNSNDRWPDLLTDRLQSMHLAMGVANGGIASNQLLRDGVGASGISHFDHDALAALGVTHVIILEGIHDTGIAFEQNRALPPPDALIAGYRQMIAVAHARHVKVIFGTLPPFKGAKYWSAQGDRVRRSVNEWIRSAKTADGFVDFDHEMGDPADPDALRPEFASSDHLHPNDRGYRAMADAVDPGTLRCDLSSTTARRPFEGNQTWRATR